MKIIKTILRILSFLSTFIIPIVLLGVISPLVHGNLGKGLTGLGYIAVALAIVVISIKLMTKVLKMKKGWQRALLLSAFPIAFWLIIQLGINYVQAMLFSISQYWIKVGIFIILGRVLAVIEECLIDPMENIESEENK